ncbi:MAG: M56 family metallopeptidase [Polyangiaceae bacterium]
MSGGLALTALVVALATMQALVCAVIVAGLMPWLRPRLESVAMAGRTRVFIIVAALPLVTGGVLVVAALGPSVISHLGVGADHCLVHLDHALHLCLRHLPETAPSITVGLVVGVGAVMAASAIWRATMLMISGRGEARSLAALARRQGVVRWIESRLPLALTAGLLHPEVYVSSGMRRGLDDLELRAAIAHEQCHARERHSLLKWLATVAAMFHLPGVRAELVSMLDLACERRADEFAATTISDRLRVASALVHAHRLVREGITDRSERPGGATAVMAFARGSRRRLDQRVRALLEDAPQVQRRSRSTWVMGAALAAAIVAHHELHHAAEHVLTFLG